MPFMNEKHLAQLESRLEQLVEGVFAGLFRNQLSAHDIAMKLARGMESNLRTAQGIDPRPLAPDRYIVMLNSEVYKRFQEARPDMPTVLSQHLVDLAAQSGYRIRQLPTLTFLANAKQAVSEVTVTVEHSEDSGMGTAAMQPVRMEASAEKPVNPQLIINGERVELLEKAIINIGRSTDNTIAVDDPYISRLHVQIRLRFGVYTLFDANSKSGTLVNNVTVTEHRLQPGDVIQIGHTRMVYMVDDSQDRSNPGFTDSYNLSKRNDG
jgi:hypothetical protein